MISYKITYSDEALEDLENSHKWYLEHSKNAAINFLFEIDEIIKKVKANPERYPVKYKNYREKKISVFPYSIIYEIDKKNHIIIVQFLFHLMRNPKLKYKNKK